MAKGSRKAKWSHTSNLMALQANCHATGRRYKPEDFDPTAKKKATEAIVKLPPKESISVLLEAFNVKRIGS